LKAVKQVLATVMTQAESNHAVLLGQIDGLMQMVSQVEVLLEFMVPHADQEKEPEEAASSSTRPASSSAAILTHRTHAAGQLDKSNGVSSRISTSSLPDLCVDTSTLADEDFTQNPLGFRQASNSSAEVKTFKDQNVSQESHDSNQHLPPRQNQKPMVACNRHENIAVPRRLKGRKRSMGSELNSVVPDTASICSSGSSHSSTKQRWSSSSRKSRIEAMSDMTRNHLMLMHGMQADGARLSRSPSSSSYTVSCSSQVRQNRCAQAARMSTGQATIIPCGTSSSDVPALPHQLVEPVDAYVKSGSSAGTRQDDEDPDKREIMSVYSDPSIIEISKQGQS